MKSQCRQRAEPPGRAGKHPGQVNDLMARVNDLTIQASNPALSAADKKTITEVNQIRDGLLSLANADDGTGRYVFGGTNDGDRRLPRSTARWSTVATRPSARWKWHRIPS
jgi:flagellin-like hook-associated protein FlgL